MFLKISQNWHENTCARVSFLIKFVLVLFSGTGVFLWILRNFQEHLFLQNTSGGCFFICTKLTVKILEWRHWHCFGVFVTIHEHILHRISLIRVSDKTKQQMCYSGSAIVIKKSSQISPKAIPNILSGEISMVVLFTPSSYLPGEIIKLFCV